jgi:hypothetical protein
MSKLMRYPLILAWTSALLLCAAGSALSQTATRAFYYDKTGNLLQIEDLSPVDPGNHGMDISKTYQGRVLQDIAEFPIPRITDQTQLKPPCPDPQHPADGTLEPMSNKAVSTIYYGVGDPNDEMEPLRPLKLEYVKDVSRKLACVKLNDSAGCPQLTRCLSTCPVCAGYCCVK